MNNEYKRLKELVFPSENKEMAEFSISFEELESIEKLNSIKSNKEALDNYIGQLEPRLEDEDDFISIQGQLKRLVNHPSFIDVKELIENDEWHLVVDYLEEQDSNYLLVNDIEQYMAQRGLRERLKEMNNMKINMNNLSIHILENMM